jgi:methyl-accepting chemotaxis protein
MVIEITGNEKVGQMVFGLLRPDQEMISSRITKVMFDMIETQKRQRLLSSEILELEFRNLSGRLISTSGNIGSSLKKVNDVFRTMKILSLNAMVEAARAGEAGKAFAVVAGEMKTLVGNAEETVKEITIASQETAGTIDNLDKAEKKLVTILQY